MLKRNLIIVAVISLSVFLTSNAFGQNNKRKRTAKKAKVVTTTNSTPTTNARTTNPTAQQSGRYANDDIGTYPNIISKKPMTNAGTTNPNGSETVNLHTQPFADGLVLEIKKKNVKAKSTVSNQRRSGTKRRVRNAGYISRDGAFRGIKNRKRKVKN